MIKIKAFFKAHLNKFIAALSALSISFTAAFTSLAPCASASSVTYADLLVDIASVSPADVVIDYANLLLDVYRFFFEDAVMADREIQRTKILAAWKTITDNSIMTEDQFADYWQQCIDELGLADDRLIMIEETVRLGFTLEDVINYCYHSDGDGVSVSDSGDVQVTGQKFKQFVDYWSDYYKPKDNVYQYTYSYQTASVKQNQSNLYGFSPWVPVYTSDGGANTGWGLKAWSGGIYLLPFLVDDDLNSGIPFYSAVYYYIHSSRSSDGVLKLTMDTYKLSDNTLTSTVTKVWDTSHMSVAFSIFETYSYLYSYASYFDYKSNTSPSTVTYVSTPSFYSGLITNLSSVPLSYFVRHVSGFETFTPDTNTRDDYGCILSSSPFYLWINQFDIDSSKIPDDYLVTLTGDTVYDYSITNAAGDTTTINNYITNNYTVPETENPDSGGGSSVGGDITVSGDIGVSGSVDVNVNVNVSNSDTEYDPTIDSYVDALPEQSDTINNYFSIFFSYLPAPLLALLLSGVAAAILARLLGR